MYLKTNHVAATESGRHHLQREISDGIYIESNVGHFAYLSPSFFPRLLISTEGTCRFRGSVGRERGRLGNPKNPENQQSLQRQDDVIPPKVPSRQMAAGGRSLTPVSHHDLACAWQSASMKTRSWAFPV